MPAVLLPDSCCASTPCVPINAYSGCDIVIKDFLNTFSLVIGSIAIAIAAVEVSVAFFYLGDIIITNLVRNFEYSIDLA